MQKAAHTSSQGVWCGVDVVMESLGSPVLEGLESTGLAELGSRGSGLWVWGIVV